MSNSFNIFLPLSKVERQRDGSVIVSGYASTPALDLDGERVSLDAVKAALPGYWAWRNIREMHRPSAVGVAQEANVDTKGLFLRSKITDKVAAQKCLDGVYKGYSIGGKKLAKQGNVITEIDMVEISVVDRPANPECVINVAKAASADASAYILPVKAEKVLAKAISSAVSEFLLEKTPAAHDGLSLPAGPIHSNNAGELCKKHGIAGCEKCAMKRAKKNAFAKREFSTTMRTQAASSGAAMPDGSYPIENVGDLHNAIQAIGRAKNPDATRRHIRRRAKALGASDTLPETWTKAGRAALSARATLMRDDAERFDLRKNADVAPSGPLSFLTLKAGGDYAGVAEGAGAIQQDALTRRSMEGGRALTKAEKKFLKAIGESSSEDETMTMTNDAGVDALSALILNLAKAGRTPTRAQHMAVAAENMRKARAGRRMARSLIESLGKMHKAAYLAKAAFLEKKAKGEKADDPGDFDHQGAMEKLQKAYGALESAKTFDKAAKEHLVKAAQGVSRAGQRGEEAADGEPGFYTVPPGVKDLTPAEMATLSPGGKESGSFPPVLDMETIFSGKAAQKGAVAVDLSRYIPREQAELLAKNAALEAENKLLATASQSGGRRPYAFNIAKLAEGAGGGQGGGFDAELVKGLNLNALGTKDENGHPSDAHTQTAGAIVGRMIMSGRYGKSVFDNQFHGTGPLGAMN